MNMFRAYWHCRLEREGKISAEEVWREALECILRQRSANGMCESCGCDISSKIIEKELGTIRPEEVGLI